MDNNNKTTWDKFLDFGKGWGLIITMITIGAAALVIVETRIFDSSEQKHDIVKGYKEGPSTEQKQRAIILDSIDKTNAIASRKMRDSVFLEIRRDQLQMIKDQKFQDSISRLNADQIFQMKEVIYNNNQE